MIPLPVPDPAAPPVIVTGLPRSGTSLVMGLLAAGGHPILTDHLRAPDPDNPQGYFEFAPVKSLMRGNAWLYQQGGQAIKIISPLLPFVPPDLPLSVIWIQRHLPEVLASQSVMLSRTGKAPPSDPTLLATAFQKQITATQAWLARRPRTRVLTLHHHELLQSPVSQISRLTDFLPCLQNHEAMLQTIDPGLHRQRLDPI